MEEPLRKKWTLKKVARMIIMHLRFSRPAVQEKPVESSEDTADMKAQLKKAQHRVTQFQLKLHELQDKNFKLQTQIEKYEKEKATLEKEAAELQRQKEEFEKEKSKRTRARAAAEGRHLSPRPRSDSVDSSLSGSVEPTTPQLDDRNSPQRIKKLEEINEQLQKETEEARTEIKKLKELSEQATRAMITDSHRELQQELKLEKQKVNELHKQLQVAVVEAMKKGMESPGNARSIDAAKLRQAEMRLETVMDNISREAAQYEIYVQQLKRRIYELEEEAADLKKNLELCASKTHLMDELLDLRAYKRLTETMNPRSRQLEVAKRQLEVQREALVMARDEIQSLSADYTKDRQLNIIRKDNERLKEENDELREELFDYHYERQSKVAVRCRKCDALEKQSLVFQQHIQNLLASKSNKEQESAQVLYWKDQVKVVNDRLCELLVNRTEQASKMKGIESEKISLQVQVAEMKKKVDETQKDSEKLSKLLDGYESLGSPVYTSPMKQDCSPTLPVEERTERFQHVQGILQQKLRRAEAAAEEEALAASEAMLNSTPVKKIKQQDLLGRLRGVQEEVIEDFKSYIPGVSAVVIASQTKEKKERTPQRSSKSDKYFDYSTRRWKHGRPSPAVSHSASPTALATPVYSSVSEDPPRLDQGSPAVEPITRIEAFNNQKQPPPSQSQPQQQAVVVRKTRASAQRGSMYIKKDITLERRKSAISESGESQSMCPSYSQRKGSAVMSGSSESGRGLVSKQTEFSPEVRVYAPSSQSEVSGGTFADF